MSILRLKELLKEKKISGKELAEEVNVTENAISMIANNKRQPRFELLLQIADFLNVDIKDLFHSTKKDHKTIQLIIDDELKTFHSVEEFKAFAKDQ